MESSHEEIMIHEWFKPVFYKVLDIYEYRDNSVMCVTWKGQS